ncbi:hypothetical protein K3495_g6690 [Podosphaera aphanis]|nr:hypothetical protein K3495_g6690 [Podosphaera aphanis]
MMAEGESSYIDYELFLSPSFSPSEFANSLVLATNNPTDTPLDLATPLSKVLFDVQEINTNIDSLTTKFALPLLTHTQDQITSGGRIAEEVVSQVGLLNDSYKRLEKEILVRYETAEEIRIIAERLWETARLGRTVGRCLQLGRQLEIQQAEIASLDGSTKRQQKGDHGALVRCAHTLLNLNELLSKTGPNSEGYKLDQVDVVRTLQSSIITPAEKSIILKSQQIIREFALPATAYFQITEIKARLASALSSLYLLSPTPYSATPETWEPEYLVNALHEYLRNALTSSLAALSRALIALPTLDRTLVEISTRCQNLVALEALLQTTLPPLHPNLPSVSGQSANFLDPLLVRLETTSLPSWFWRTLARGISTRMVELVSKGGMALRVLRSNRSSIIEAIRDCVMQGVQAPGKRDTPSEGTWEREIAVMTGSISGPLGK